MNTLAIQTKPDSMKRQPSIPVSALLPAAKLGASSDAGYAAALDWLADQRKAETLNRKATSYGHKHTAERWNRARGVEVYISNEDLIAAARDLGFRLLAADTEGTNFFINIGRPRKVWTARHRYR
jgi:hypothetical protein